MEKPETTPTSEIMYQPRAALSLRQKLQLVRGKLHRFYVGHLNKSYVRRRLERRKGECARCGACCRLLIQCAFADDCHGGTACRIYKRRPVNCRIFPLHRRDLSERDLVLPGLQCGYYFED